MEGSTVIKQYVEYNENLEKNIEVLSKGAFLTTKTGNKVNSMSIAWGSIGFMWGKPIFMVMVRPQRYTYGIIEKTNEFTVTIPYKKMNKEIEFLGKNSGKDINKLLELKIDTVESEKINTPILAVEGMHFECKVVYKTKMNEKNLEEAIKRDKYPLEDYHTLYFGEIVSSYTIN